jgi:hypothetical protein
MADHRTPRGAHLTDEQLVRVEAARQAARTPEARAREEAVRRRFADKPGLDELVRRGEMDPEQATTMGAVIALHKAVAAVRRERQGQGLGLDEVAHRAGLVPDHLRRIEDGQGARPTWEILVRYAAAVGLDVEVVVRPRDDGSRPVAAPSSPATASRPEP